MNSEAIDTGHRRKRISPRLFVVFVLLSLIGSCTYYINRRTNPFPEISRIEDITATMIEPGVVNERGFYRLKLKVPETEWQALKELFENSQIDPLPTTWEVFYRFEVTEGSGVKTDVTVFALHYDDELHAGAFRFDRTYYRGGRDEAFADFIRRIAPKDLVDGQP